MTLSCCNSSGDDDEDEEAMICGMIDLQGEAEEDPVEDRKRQLHLYEGVVELLDN